MSVLALFNIISLLNFCRYSSLLPFIISPISSFLLFIFSFLAIHRFSLPAFVISSTQPQSNELLKSYCRRLSFAGYPDLNFA